MVRLSIIILSYNTKSLTEQCIQSLLSQLQQNQQTSFEIVVVDNGSRDGSVQMLNNLKFKIKNLKLILNNNNIGYPKGNNQALKMAKGEYILFLNSDVIVENVDFDNILSFLDDHQQTAVLTVKVVLPDKTTDPASHRGFPNIWNSFCYFFGLERLFKRVPVFNKFFGGYHLVHLDLNTIHEIDSPTGAFYLTRKNILDKLNGFDEDFFMYGEDIDLSFRIKELGYHIIYNPQYRVIHLKHASGLDQSDEKTRKKTREYFYEAMKIFYKKHYERIYPSFINNLVYFFINLKKKAYV